MFECMSTIVLKTNHFQFVPTFYCFGGRKNTNILSITILFYEQNDIIGWFVTFCENNLNNRSKKTFKSQYIFMNWYKKTQNQKTEWVSENVR